MKFLSAGFAGFFFFSFFVFLLPQAALGHFSNNSLVGEIEGSSSAYDFSTTSTLSPSPAKLDSRLCQGLQRHSVPMLNSKVDRLELWIEQMKTDLSVSYKCVSIRTIQCSIAECHILIGLVPRKKRNDSGACLRLFEVYKRTSFLF